MSSSSSRKSKGRQKVSMVKMEKQSNLQVTFSKRRAGLFKKASELCTLCGAEAAIVVFSPAEKAYCFGHPNLKTLLDRQSEGTAPPTTDPRSQLVMEAHRNSTIRQLNVELTQAEGLLRAEKRRAQEMDSTSKAGCPPLEGLGYAQLCMLKESVMGFKKKVDDKVQKHMVRVSDNAYQTDHNLSVFSSSNGVGLFGSNDSSINYGMFGLMGGSSSSSMIPDNYRAMGGNGFGFSLGHDQRPGFF